MSEMTTKGLFQTACDLRGQQLKPVIKCGSHEWQPYHIVCIHLLEGISEWHPVALTKKDCREVDSDWLCPKCLAKYGASDVGIVDYLVPACVECLRKVKKTHRLTVRDGQPRTYELMVLDRTEHKDGQAKRGKGVIWYFDKADVSWVCDCCEPSAEFMKAVRVAAGVPDGKGLRVDLDVVAESGFEMVLGTHHGMENGNEIMFRYLIERRRLPRTRSRRR